MTAINELRKRKAVSPVIATVILVAVAIMVAVAVSYWMSGIAGQYTSFEKVEIQTGYSTYTPTSGWIITLSLKNSGSATSTITHLFINDVPVTLTANAATNFAAANTIVTSLTTGGLPIDAGASTTIKIWIDLGYGSLSSGTTVNVKLHSAGGMDYIKLIKLV